MVRRAFIDEAKRGNAPLRIPPELMGLKPRITSFQNGTLPSDTLLRQTRKFQKRTKLPEVSFRELVLKDPPP